MTQYNTLNVTLSNSQFDKLKSRMINCTEVTLKLCWCNFENLLLVILMMRIIFRIIHKFQSFVKLL